MKEDGGAGRLVFVDAARTLACVLVVLVHANYGFRPGLDTWWPGGLFGAPAFALAVPIFFAVAGLVAERGLAKEPAGAWLLARFARLVPPYLVWNAILLASGAQGPDLTAVQRLAYLVFGSRHLYFVCALLQLLALHSWLGRRCGGRLLVAASFGLTAAYFIAADAAAWATGVRAEVFEVDLNRLFPAWAAFYATGAWLGRSKDGFERVDSRRGVLALVAAVSYAVFVLELHGMLQRFGFHPVRQFLFAGLPFQLVGTLLVLETVRRLEGSSRAREIVARLAATGPDTFAIYLSHVSVQSALFALAVSLGYAGTDAIEVPVLAAATWLFCRAGIALARRVLRPRAAALLLGVGPPGRRPAPAGA